MFFEIKASDITLSYFDSFNLLVRVLAWVNSNLLAGSFIGPDRSSNKPSLVLIPKLEFQNVLLTSLSSPPENLQGKFNVSIIKEENDNENGNTEEPEVIHEEGGGGTAEDQAADVASAAAVAVAATKIIEEEELNEMEEEEYDENETDTIPNSDQEN